MTSSDPRRDGAVDSARSDDGVEPAGTRDGPGPGEPEAPALEPIEEVVVVGTGFVGLPLALLLADRGKRVVGVDIDSNLVRAINEGTLHLDEAELQALLESDAVERNLEARTEPTDGDAFVVSVPTPLTEPTKSPDLSALEAALESIRPYLEPGDLVNVESTVPPLTCAETVVPALEAAGLEPGAEIQLAHSPERILPGDVFEELVTNDRIIGGIDERSRRRAAALYEPFLEGRVYYTDLLSAELCKLVENTYRDVNVALANEFALIGEELDVDMSEVIGLANYHPRVDILQPGIGVGGHCLPIDPWFLNEVDPEHTNLITTARRINDKMPAVAARKVRRTLAPLADPTVVALGAAYKPNVDDRRNSPAERIVADLRADGYRVRHYDRHVDALAYDELRAVLERESPDVVVQFVPHEETVAALAEHRAWLDDAGIELLQFGVGNPIDP
ncbi:nucleotide sugar dehydrogenase [Natrinema ejinorense]|uniref:UDP-N-acetyl-D-mannosamine dehydrogenase n=1 Tax=Natrinema ejinorense TaxID=373386 RepID=A0A2A5QZC2_9EURY|nr:nucleotide sugar dehydrogenase [Natrinema ejinorense]PCR92176.1 nucleotide sugar dehydrogenase [Natrinema ejinorense]